MNSIDNEDKKQLILKYGKYLILIVVLVIAILFIRSCGQDYNDIENKMIELTKNYISKNSMTINNETYITITELGEIEGTELCSKASGVIVSNNNGSLKYQPYLKCGDYKTDVIKNKSKYIVLNGSRPSNSYAPGITDAMLGEIGTCFWLNFTNEFFEYIKTLNRLDGNILIMDFLMNLLDGDVAGISFDETEVCWDADYGHTFDTDLSDNGATMVLGDCNGDATVNSMDAYLMKLALIGSDVSLDPFAVDVNCDGNLNAMDSFALKKTVVSG